MKALTMRKLKMRGLTALILMSFSPSIVLAQDYLLDDNLEDLNMSVSNEQINIDGTIKRESVADRMAKQRKLLEKKHEEMVHKKIEDMRLKEEQKIARQLQKALSGQAMAIDSIGSTQAAPQKLMTKLKAPKKKKVNKIFLEGGGKQFTGDSINGLEATFSTGFGFETVIASRFGLGFNINYTRMSMEDVANAGFGNYYNYGNQYNNNNNFNNFPVNTRGDKIIYNNVGFGLSGKFYITKDTMVKPYVGLNANYNKTTLSYESRTQTNQYSIYNNGINDSVTAGYFSGGIHAGAEFNFTDTFAMNLDLGFTKALTNGFNKDERNLNTYRNFDEILLNNIGQIVEKTDVLSIDLGLGFKF